MNSEQLGALVADLLRDLAPAGVAPRQVVVHRARPAGDVDLVTAASRSLAPGSAAGLAAAVGAHPDVDRATVDDGVLRVSLTDDSRSRDLAGAAASLRPVDLRAPDRVLHLGGAGGPLSADEARRILGADAVAYALARAHRPRGGGAGEVVCVDVDAVVARTPASPLFVVQHAHARAAALISRAAALGLGPVRDNESSWERRGAVGELVGALLELPATVTRAVRRDEIRLVPAHLEEIAVAFGELEPERRFLPAGDEEVTSSQRVGLALVATTQELLAWGLGVLGVAAPARI